MKILDLFSGIGGFSLGLEAAGMETVAFCEVNSFCQKVLKKHWPDTPIYNDIKELNGHEFKGKVDLVCGGFPCQPFSIAGSKKGKEDDRDLWPEMFRIIKQARPTWVIGENVAHFTNMAFTRTKADLESEGYTVQPFIIPACAIGAPHRRDRVWVVAYTNSERLETTGAKQQTTRFEGSFIKQSDREEVKPLLCGEDARIPDWMDRVKSLGNSVAPHIPYVLGKFIQELHQSEKVLDRAS